MKRIAICILLIACMLAAMMNVYVSAAQMSVRVVASNEDVQVGDTVEFTVLATGQDMVALQFEVRLPEGLAYIPNSGGTPEGLAQKLGIPAAEWTEQSMMFTCYNDVGVTVPEGTQLLSFSCVAEKAGDWTAELVDLIPFDSDFQAFSAELQIQTVRVKEAGESKPAEPDGVTDPTVTAPEVPETPAATEPAADVVTQPVTVPDQIPEQPKDEPLQDPTVAVQDQTDSDQPQPTEPEEQTPPVEKTGKNTPIWILTAGGVILVGSLVAWLFFKRKR